jgi:hypothetical protein
MNLIIFFIIALICNGTGLIISDTVLNGLFHPSGIGFVFGVIAIVVSDVLSEVLQ